MSSSLGSEKIVTVLAVALSLLLAGTIAYEWQWGERFRQELTKLRKPDAKAVFAALLPEFALLPREAAYNETLTRPIFIPSRRGSPTSSTGGQQMKKGQFVLSGVIIVPGQRLALLRDVTTGKSERVEQGNEIRGMQAERVDAGAIVLKQGNETEELVLMVQRAPAPQQNGGNAAELPSIPAKPSGLASVTVSEPAKPLDTDDQRIEEQERQRQKQLENYQENNRIRKEKGMPLLPIPPSLLEPIRKK
ncbi:MAG: hypothetical protein KKH74_02745 [Gammaproteobacteria bacterium]|nr:hypothetical protein [Gammaproteobacteria bacterium]MBU1732909.1 hypothetical protein [Gammaproteobacteria bacterium]MBU1891957.1 hypothetical protein [Gammaproteobacteria bacterium]